MKQDVTNNFFLTSDLALATTLNMSFPLEDIDRGNPRKAAFVFRRSAELEKTVDEYFTNKIMVTPQSYFNQLRDLKNRLYSERVY
jgi:hypothetical protein